MIVLEHGVEASTRWPTYYIREWKCFADKSFGGQRYCIRAETSYVIRKACKERLCNLHIEQCIVNARIIAACNYHTTLTGKWRTSYTSFWKLNSILIHVLYTMHGCFDRMCLISEWEESARFQKFNLKYRETSEIARRRSGGLKL